MVKHGKVSKSSAYNAHGGIGSVHISALAERDYSTVVAARGIPEYLKVIVKEGWKILNRYLNIEGLGEKG